MTTIESKHLQDLLTTFDARALGEGDAMQHDSIQRISPVSVSGSNVTELSIELLRRTGT
jgi:hypothetical protein